MLGHPSVARQTTGVWFLSWVFFYIIYYYSVTLTQEQSKPTSGIHSKPLRGMCDEMKLMFRRQIEVATSQLRFDFALQVQPE